MSHSGHVRRSICSSCRNGLYGLHRQDGAAKIHRRFIGSSEAASESRTTVHRPLRHLRPHNTAESDQRIAQLPSTSLGLPSEILVLRDPEKSRRGGPHRVSQAENPSNDEQAFMTTDGILASIQAERKSPVQEEVNQHLNTLRPRTQYDSESQKLVLSKAAYQNLHAAISDGFTLLQLSRFLSMSQSQVTQEPTKSDNAVADSLFTRTRWTTSNAWLEAQDASSTKGIKSRKHNIVEKILKVLWNVQIYGEHNIEGSVDVRMRKDLLELFIIGGKSSTLSNIGRKTSVRVDVLRSEGIVVITGTESSCNNAIKDIESFAEGYIESTFPLSKDEWRKLTVGSPLLAALSRRTRSVISVSKHVNNSLSIQSLMNSDSEKARRLLLSLTAGTGRTERRLADGLLPKTSKDPMIFAPALDNLGVSLLDRHTTLGRSVMSTSISRADVAGSQQPRSLLGRERTQQVLARVMKELRRENKHNQSFILCKSQLSDHSDTYESTGWRTLPGVVTRCNFGQLLHPKPRPARKPTVAQNSSLLTTSRSPQLKGPYVFDYQSFANNTLVQTLFRTSRSKSADQTAEAVPEEDSLSLESNNSAVSQKPSHIFSISLVSSEVTKGSDRDKYPDIELWLNFDPTSQQVQSSRLIATLRRQEVGVFSPDLRTDVLFTRTSQLVNDDPTRQPSIKSFVEEFQTRVDGLGEINPPSHVVVSLPSGAILGRNTADGDASFVDVDYEVTSLRYHERFTQSHLGYQLTWDYNEAGDIGGRYEALYLEMASDSDPTEAGLVVYNTGEAKEEGNSEDTPNEWLHTATFIRSSLGLLDSIEKSIG